MKRKKMLISVVGLIVVAMIVVIALLTISETVDAEYPSGYAKSFGEFTAKTASEFFDNNKGNTCYSSVSLYAALSLVAETTEGATRDEILGVLGVEDIDTLEEYYSCMQRDLEVSDDESIITLCNGLWLNEAYTDKNTNEVINECKEKFGCDVFLREVIKADEVNSWVSEKTNGFINSGINIDDTIPNVLVNTLYYNSKWAYEASDIGEKTFTLEDGSEIKAEYIACKKTNMNYFEGDKYIIVNVLLKNGKMIFVLPNEKIKLENLVSENNINDILSLVTSNNMEKCCINISIPKFEINDAYTSKMKSVLNKLGINSLYNDSQWILSDGLNGKDVDIKQKTKIVLDENGIEAAAATLSVMYTGIEDVTNTKDIILDRPFLYILMKDDVPLFIGTVYDPTE